MDEHRWQQIQEIFARTADLPADAQRAAVEEICEGDESLQGEVRDEVLAMLAEDHLNNPLLDSGLDETARAVLDFGPLPSLIQREIGPYRLLKLLGEGGMGVVYLAERTDIGGQVAIKLLRDGWLSPMRRQRFRMEQLTLAQLNHPGIARIYDSNTLEDGTPWFVMEYADGLPLTEHWSLHPGMVRDCLHLIRKVCEAVQYAHSHAIIHRDLKPSNILVTESGAVKLLDFGIAKQLNSEEPRESRTVTGLRMMTLAYAAPEQLAGKAVGVYTDVYALGVQLYELLTGRLPQRNDASGASAAGLNTTENEIEKPSSLLRREKPETRAQLSKAEWADLDVLSLKALEPDPARRYSTVDALIRDLDALLEGRPLEARPSKLSYTIGKFARRNRRVLLSVAAMFVLIAATVIFYTVRLQRARNAAVREAARTREIQQFTESLFDGGDESAGPAMDLKAVQLLDRGRLQAASLGSDPEMQSDMQETLGGIYQKLGKLDLADPLLVSALEERKKIAGDEGKVANSLVALGLLRKDQGKLEEAETLVRQGLEMNQRLQSASSTDVARSMVALGSVLEVRAKYDQARQVLETALKMQPQNRSANAETSENLTELANVYFYQGDYDLSEKFNNQALEIDRRLLGDENPSVAQELNNLGAIEMNRGNYPASEAYYRRALAITESWYGTDHPETAADLTALAQPLTFDKHEAEAQSLLERALAIQKRVNGPIDATVASTQNQLGILAFERRQLDAAQSYFTQARDTWKQLFGDQYPSVAVAYSNLGSVCLEQKNLKCAEEMYREAVRRLDASSANSLNDAVAHLKLGRALLREGRFAEAEPEALFGYSYLVKNVGPNDRFLTFARKDLAAIYDGLHHPDKAAHYRSELAEAAQGAQ
jgi:serine/threonine protein kinase/Tfp pilus assembly protein PilF